MHSHGVPMRFLGYFEVDCLLFFVCLNIDLVADSVGVSLLTLLLLSYDGHSRNTCIQCTTQSLQNRCAERFGSDRDV